MRPAKEAPDAATGDDHIYYRQCLLRHTDGQQIVWMPESLGVDRGGRVCVDGRDGWMVAAIWQRGTLARLKTEGVRLRDDITRAAAAIGQGKQASL